MQQLLGHLVVALVARMVEGDQDLVRQPPAVAWGARKVARILGTPAFLLVFLGLACHALHAFPHGPIRGAG
jgi:hypothetical protein